MAKIMHLVGPKMMMEPAVTAPMNPIRRLIITLGDDMRAVLDRRNLSDEEKVRKYNQFHNAIWNTMTISKLHPYQRIPTLSRKMESSERFL